MEDKMMNMVVFGVASWGSGFVLVRKMLPKRSFQFCTRIISTVHASLAVILGLLSVQNWSCPICPLSSPPSPQQAKALSISMAYLIYDLICGVFDSKMDIDNCIHHFLGIVGIWAAFAYRSCGAEAVAVLSLAEISTPFLHLREILKELGYRDTDLNLAADIGFAVIFSFARMVVGPFLTYAMLTGPNALLLQASALGLQLVSAFWFYKIAKMVKFKLAKRKQISLNPKNSE